MPDASHPSLGRAESSTLNGTPTPSMSSKTLPNLNLTTTTSNTNTQNNKGGKMAPKVDLEPIYTELKKVVGEGWNVYKEAVTGFMLGLLSQKELARLTDHIVLPDPLRESLHNQLICAIYTNASREVPEAGVASWVSSNDKHGATGGIGGAGMKHVGGDVAEQRLRVEVMQLPPRVRGRLKGIIDDPPAPLLHSLAASRTQSRLQTQKEPPSLLPSLSQSNTQSTNTPTTNLNQSVEVRRRYNLPLGTESHDLPQPSTLADRITPICYEEGLPTGPREADVCVELLSVGLEAFLKEVLVSVLGRSVVNAPISGPPPAAIVVPDAGKVSGDALLAGGSVVPASTAQTTTATAAPTVSLTGAAVGITSGPRMGVLTAAYKRKLSSEEAAVIRGQLKRSDLGLLPCEVAALDRQRELDAAMTGVTAAETEDEAAIEKEKLVGVPSDLRLAWELGDHWLRDVVPWMGEKFVSMDEESLFDVRSGSKNGDAALMTNGLAADDEMDIDGEAEPDGDEEMDWEWQGAGASDRAALGALLDDCLAIGQ